MAVRSGSSSSSVQSLAPPCPKPPPGYSDLYAKRRETAKVQMLEREISFLEVELKSIEGLPPASKCCKEVTDFVMQKSDPLTPAIREKRKSSRFRKWLCGFPCFNMSWICCCFSGCSSHLKCPPYSDCNPCDCNCSLWNYICSSCKCSLCDCTSCKCSSCDCNLCKCSSCDCRSCKCSCCDCSSCKCSSWDCSSCKCYSCNFNSCLRCCTIPKWLCCSCPKSDCRECCCRWKCSCPKCPNMRLCCTCTKTCCNPCCLLF